MSTYKLIDRQGNYATAKLTGKPFEYTTRDLANIALGLLEARDKCAYIIVRS